MSKKKNKHQNKTPRESTSKSLTEQKTLSAQSDLAAVKAEDISKLQEKSGEQELSRSSNVELSENSVTPSFDESFNEEAFDEGFNEESFEEDDAEEYDEPDTAPKKSSVKMTKRDRILVICAVSFVAVALIVGLVLGFLTGGQEKSELTGLSFSEIKERVMPSCIVPELESYNAEGTLLFGKKLSYEDMKKRENDEYIVQYELVYTSKSGSGGFIFTATNADNDKLDVSLLKLAEKYKEPIYLESDKNKVLPVYVQTSEGTNGNYVVTLCLEFHGQIIGLTTQYSDIDKAVGELSGRLNAIMILNSDIFK